MDTSMIYSPFFNFEDFSWCYLGPSLMVAICEPEGFDFIACPSASYTPPKRHRSRVFASFPSSSSPSPSKDSAYSDDAVSITRTASSISETEDEDIIIATEGPRLDIKALEERKRLWRKRFNKTGCMKNQNHCVFCKTNQASEKDYRSHTLKNENGEVVCPVLFKYVCPICSATGSDAHTVKYCPNA